ncbi:cyclophilin-like fold protein [Falsiroseomonas ponticola]|uniref:cyclophilin-like fold protein n=1 Tax=Falsiroseomonas ponticola TaxID=2786951 RepID=UPI0019316EF7|nr:cyclophilin-like fold protein [Roseomonas ponticola]
MAKVVAALAALPAAARAQGGAVIRLRLGRVVLPARLDDHATARDFASLLPLALTLRDHAATEKISDLPRRLTLTGAPAGHDPRPGDIAYYAPWGNLAIFHRDFGYSAGLVRLGRIEGDLAALSRPGTIAATIEVAA